MPTPKKTTTDAADQPKVCLHVRTQAELDAALSAGSTCIHVHGGAEESVLEWQAANPPAELEINGEWT